MIINKDTLHTLDLNRLMVLDCRNVMDQPQKTQALIENEPFDFSVHIPESPFMYTKDGINDGRHPLPYKEQINALYEALTEDGGELILTADNNSFYHTRLYYLFNLYGLDAYLYNGVLSDLTPHKETFRLYNGTLPETIPGSQASFKSDIFRSMTDIQNYVDGAHNVLLIDVRSHERYLGISEPIDFKKGHIPGAVNIPNPEIYKDGLLNLHALDGRLEDIKQFNEVVVYCGSGMSATPMFTLLDYHGINVKLYAGSFSEWITDEMNMVETKENIL